MLVTLALVAAGRALWNKRADDTAKNATVVRLETVRRGTLAELVQAPGEIQPRTKVSISARVSARIVELPHDVGTTVTRGDAGTSPSVLVRLDATDLDAQLRSAQARYAAQNAQIAVQESRIAGQKAQMVGQRATLESARRELERETDLRRTNFTSQSQYDEAKRRFDEAQASYEMAEHELHASEAGLRAARHNLEAAEAEITKARDNLSYATITSPIDGVVTRVNSKVGEIAVIGTMNNQGTVILEVADLSQMLMQARVGEGDIASVARGQRAKVRIQAYRDRVYDGVVEQVALAPTSRERETDKNFYAEIRVAGNGDRILSGLTADADIETSRHEGVLKVPSQAVLGRAPDTLPEEVRKLVPAAERDNSVATVVAVMRAGRARLTPVRVGPSDATHTVITEGLREGDRVVVGPFKVLETIAHDAAVREDTATTATATGDATTTAAKTR